jgi:cytochrome b561
MLPGNASSASYSRTAVGLHWLIVALLICAFALGWVMTDLAISPLKLRMFSWHKWVGITILLATIFRLAWRLGHAPPPMLPAPAWQLLSAKLLHALLYVLLLAIPLSGWAYSSAAGFPVVYLGLLPLPDLLPKDKALAAQWVEIHESAGWALLGASALHFAAALKHQFIDRDATLSRMLSWRR